MTYPMRGISISILKGDFFFCLSGGWRQEDHGSSLKQRFCMVSFPQLEVSSIIYTPPNLRVATASKATKSSAQGIMDPYLFEGLPDISLSKFLLEGSRQSTLFPVPSCLFKNDVV